MACFARAQGASFVEFLNEQVALGRWHPEERLSVLEYLRQEGLPVVKEEAWVIEGVSAQTAQELMASKPWGQLVARGRASEGAESQLKLDAIANRSPLVPLQAISGVDALSMSTRLQNPGKWGVRIDGTNPTQNGLSYSGFIQFKTSNQRWKGLVGGHRLGWGHRLTVDEASLFGAIDDPVFVLPTQIDFSPAWGTAAYVPRMGGVITREGSAMHITASMHDQGRDWACLVQPHHGRWGSIVQVVDGKILGTGLYAQGFARQAQGLAELTRAAERWSFAGSLQRTPSRKTESHIKWRLAWQGASELEAIEVQWGGQRQLLNPSWRVRWNFEWRDDAVEHPWSVQVRHHRKGAHYELRWKGVQRTVLEPTAAAGRLEVRGEWESHGVNLQLRAMPVAQPVRLGGVAIRVGYDAGAIAVKLLFAAWDMPTETLGYFADLAPNGVQYRPMRGNGFRTSLSIRMQPAPKLHIQLVGTVTERPRPTGSRDDMLTSTFAQSAVHLVLRLKM